MGWAIEREYIPKTGGNDTAPDDEQVRIYYRPFKVGESTEFAAQMMKHSAATIAKVPDATRLEAELSAAANGGDGDVAAICEEMVKLGEQTDSDSQALLRLAFKRITRGVRGSEEVKGGDAVWDAVSDDEELVNEIAFAVINSAKVSKSQRPF